MEYTKFKKLILELLNIDGVPLKRIRFLAGGKVNISSIFEVTVLLILNVFVFRSGGIMRS